MRNLKLRHHHIISLFIIVLISGNALSRDKNKSTETVTYKQFLDRVSAVLPELKKNKIQVEKAKNTLYGAGSAEDINLTAETGYSKTDEFSKGTTTGKKDLSSKLGLSKKIAQTGSNLNVGAAYNRTEYGSVSDPYYYPSLYVKFSQSLLKNAFGIVDRYAVNNAKMQYDIAKLKEIQSNKTDLNYYRKLYFLWIEYREQLKLLNISINTALKLSESVKGKYRSGLVNNADLHSSDAFVLKYRIAYEELKTDMNAMETELSIFFTGNDVIPDDTEFSGFFSTAASAGYADVEFGKTTSAEIYRITKKNLQYSYDVAENKLLPQLDFIAEYTKKAQNDSFSKSVENMNSTDYYLGFSFSYPLQNTESKSKADEAKLAIDEINSEYSVSENSYKKSLYSIISRYKDSEQLVSLREKRIKSLEAKYRFELQKYQQSQLDLETVINTSIDITNEKISLIQLKKQIIDNYIDYKDLTEISG
jgi:outer membrane protein TolC